MSAISGGQGARECTRTCLCTLTILTWLAFALRVVGLDFQSLWRDEVDAIRYADQPWSEVLQRFVMPGQNGPLYYLLLNPWLRLAGQSEFSLRFFSVIWGVVAVALVFRVARKLFPSVPALAALSALLAALSPYLVWYSQEGKMYSLALTLVLWSMDCYLAALWSGEKGRWMLYVLATAAAVYVHLTTLLVLPVQVLAGVLAGRSWRVCRRSGITRAVSSPSPGVTERGESAAARLPFCWMAGVAAVALTCAPVLAWLAPLAFRPAETGFRFVPLPAMLHSLVVTYVQGVVWSEGSFAMGLVIVLLSSTALLAMRNRSHGKAVALIVFWFLIPVLGLFVVSLSRPLYTARYLSFVLPALLLLLAAGMVGLARRSRLLAILSLGWLLTIDLWGLWLQARTVVKADFRGATQYVARRLSPADLVLFQIPHGRHSFDYYLPPLETAERSGSEGAPYHVYLPILLGRGPYAYRYAEGVYTNKGMEQADVDRRMLDLVGHSAAVWLVETEAEMWDERGLVRAWLDRHGRLCDVARFVRVVVYRYELR